MVHSEHDANFYVLDKQVWMMCDFSFLICQYASMKRLQVEG